MEGCTLQFHPDSTHTLGTYVVLAYESAKVALSQCQLVGPAPGNAKGMRSGIAAIKEGTAILVRAALVLPLVAQVQSLAA
jgi:hypothetical protein